MTILKRTIIILSLIIMSTLVLPLIAISKVNPRNGMIVVIFMFFAINPIVSICTGILSGQDIKHFWWTPIAIAVLFWTFSSFTFKTAFPIVYSTVYFVISSVSMFIAYIISKK